MIQVLGVACAAAILGMSGWGAFRTWPRPIHLVTESFPPVRFERGTMIVPLLTKVLLAEVGKFDDELSACLWFDYLRSRHAIWKRRPAKDDIVLKRDRHRVLVSDYSIG